MYKATKLYLLVFGVIGFIIAIIVHIKFSSAYDLTEGIFIGASSILLLLGWLLPPHDDSQEKTKTQVQSEFPPTCRPGDLCMIKINEAAPSHMTVFRKGMEPWEGENTQHLKRSGKYRRRAHNWEPEPDYQTDELDTASM